MTTSVRRRRASAPFQCVGYANMTSCYVIEHERMLKRNRFFKRNGTGTHFQGTRERKLLIFLKFKIFKNFRKYLAADYVTSVYFLNHDVILAQPTH